MTTVKQETINGITSKHSEFKDGTPEFIEMLKLIGERAEIESRLG